jgi:phage baseplate assembly protein W
MPFQSPVVLSQGEATFLDYPYGIGAEGSARQTTDTDHLRDLIIQVLLTNPGERVNLPEFGVGIQRLVFAPNSEALRASTQFLVTTNLRRWLGDKIDVERVDVTSFPGEEETVTIEIVFVEKRTRERRSLQLQV